MNMKSQSSVKTSPGGPSDVGAIICPAQPDPAFLSNLHGDAMTGVFVHQFSAGFIMTQISLETAEILTFTVLPSQRGKGYGAVLLKTAMQHAFNKGATRILLEVAPDRKAALGLYRSAGFERTGVRKNYYAGPEGKRDAFLMETGLGTELNFR
jgi:ribosomal-protein-alanine N-acetyltransferase